MSKQSLDQVIQRASSDARFKALLGDNFEGAVRPYDLSDDEKALLAKGLGLSAAATSHPMPAVAAGMEVAMVEAPMEAAMVEAPMEVAMVDASTLDETNL